MGEVINLRSARKARKRSQDKAKADANRVLHGLTKAEKYLAGAARQRQDAAVEGARRDRGEPASPPGTDD